MNCVFAGIVALQFVGITLSTVPAIVVTDEYSHGLYKPNVVYIHPSYLDNCKIYTHEFVHHWQFIRNRPYDEFEADWIATRAMEEYNTFQLGR